MKPIQKVASRRGNHGQRIAAHLANAGVATVLLDIVARIWHPIRSPAPAARSPPRTRSARKIQAAAFFEASLAVWPPIGNFDDDLAKSLTPIGLLNVRRRSLTSSANCYRKVDAHRAPAPSSLPTPAGFPCQNRRGFSRRLRRNWFFGHALLQPPRYMRLLEIIPTEESDSLRSKDAQFCDITWQRQIVRAKDTPNFIGNRIGIFSMLNVMP